MHLHMHLYQGRKPWTQITVTLPIKPATTAEEDLAVVWAMMRGAECLERSVKEKENGDVVWHLWGDQYLTWLNIDPDKTKPVNKYVHPVLYETGARKQTMMENKIKKAEKAGNFYLAQQLAKELDEYEAAQAAKQPTQPSGNDYHWSTYDEVVVTYKKEQTRKVAKELQLTVKVRTAYLGSGDPKENNGYLGGGSSRDLDPESEIYALLRSVGM